MSETNETAESSNASSNASSREETASPESVLIDAWFAKHFHNLGAGLDEQLYNRIYAAKDDLKVLLAGVTPPAS